MNFRQHETNLLGVKAGGSEDLTVLSSEEFAGRQVTPDEVFVRGMLLCHDQLDRSFERFPQSYLQRFAETLPGKSVLTGHRSDLPPVGRFFAAGIERRQEMFPVPVTGRKQRGRDAEIPAEKSSAAPAGFRSELLDVSYLAARFYFPRTPNTETLAAMLDLGVQKHVSIGFRYDDIHCDLCGGKSYLGADCPHVFGWESEDGRVATGTYGGRVELAEAMEGSIVYLGCQPLARIERLAESGELDPEREAQRGPEPDLVLLKAAEALARQHGHQKKSWAFPGLAKAVPPTEPQGVTMNEQEVAAKAAEELHALRSRAEQAEAALKGAAAKVEQAEKLVDVILGDIATEYLADLIRTGQPDTMPKLVVEMLRERRDYSKLKELREEARSQVLGSLPVGLSGDPGAVPDSRGDAAASQWSPYGLEGSLV